MLERIPCHQKYKTANGYKHRSFESCDIVVQQTRRNYLGKETGNKEKIKLEQCQQRRECYRVRVSFSVKACVYPS